MGPCSLRTVQKGVLIIILLNNVLNNFDFQKILAQSDLRYKLTNIKPKVTKKTATRVAVQLPNLKLHKAPRSFSNKQHAVQEVIKILGLKI
jgi:hypothetical protein